MSKIIIIFLAAIAFMVVLFELTSIVNAQDYTEEFTNYEEYQEKKLAGFLLCVHVNNRNELVKNGIPNDAIFLHTDDKTRVSKWCVVLKDNSAEVLYGGIYYLVATIADAFGYPIHNEDDSYKVDFESPIDIGNPVRYSDEVSNHAKNSFDYYNLHGMAHFGEKETNLVDNFFKWVGESLTPWDVDNNLDDVR